jgi:RING-variant domain
MDIDGQQPEQVAQPSQSSSSIIYPVRSKDSSRYCWVCFATEEDDIEAEWVQPCNCRGTTKWVSFLCCT